MIRDGHVSTAQLVAMIVIVILGKGLDSAVLIFVHWGHGAPELLLLVAELAMLCVIALLIPLLKAQDKNLIDLVYDLFGPWIGAVMGVILFVFLLADLAVNLQFDMEQVKIVFLPTTPIPIILFLTIAGMIVPLYYGIEVIGRSNLLVLVGMLVIVCVLIPLSLSQLSLSNLPPLLGPGIPTLLLQGLIHCGFFGEYLSLLMLRPNIRSYPRFRLAYLVGAGICLVVGMVGLLDLQMVFPYPTDDHVFFPFIEIARLLYFGRFIQHIEAAFAVTWMFVALARLSILLYVLSVMAASTARASNYRRFVPPIAAVIYYGALMFPSLAYAIDFKDVVLLQKGIYFYGGVASLIIVVGYWKMWRKKKRTGDGDREGGRQGGDSQKKPRQASEAAQPTA